MICPSDVQIATLIMNANIHQSRLTLRVLPPKVDADPGLHWMHGQAAFLAARAPG
jgi:hypothetical protein